MDDEPKSPGDRMRSALVSYFERRSFPPGEYLRFSNNLDAVGLRIVLWLVQDCGITNPGAVMKIVPYIDWQAFESCVAEWVEQDLRKIAEDSARAN